LRIVEWLATLEHMSDDFEEALKLLAKMRGVTVDVIKREMLEKAMGVGTADPAPTPTRAITRPDPLGDASGAALARTREEAVQRHRSQEFEGSPVVRYRGDDRGESAEEARERWYEEEAELLDGVHGLGGSTAGGIFGGGPIATNIYDPEAMGRADSRTGQMANIKLLGVIERLEQRLIAAEAERGQLPPSGGRGALPGAASRRLGRGK
jgi:hypothetical protein